MPPVEHNGPSVRLALGADIIQSVGEKALTPPSVRLSITDNGMPSKKNRYDGALVKPSPVVRLAAAGTLLGKNPNRPVISKPTGRLAIMPNQGVKEGSNNLNSAAFGPSIKLAHVPGAQGDNLLMGRHGMNTMPDNSLPALLVSYYYLEQFEANKERYCYRDWVMDSGAFSAHNSGVEIKLQDYIDCCKRLMESDPTLTEVYALDVIGDWKAGVKNTEEMWKQGVPAIPCFHYGEPWELLKYMAKTYPKVAIGGCVGRRDKDKFAGQCFARVWPKKLHGFGFGSETSIMMFPWHSVDATNWEIGPCKYGSWRAFGGQRVSVRGSRQNLRAEVEWYLELERRAREKWKKEMALLEQQKEVLPQSVRLVVGTGRSQDPHHIEQALGRKSKGAKK